jgi:hypothetical protein
VKKQLPIAIGVLVGIFAVIEFYLPAHAVGSLQGRLLDYGLILAAAAYVLGGVNVLQVNVPKIRRRDRDWQYKIVLLASAAVMALVGVAWHTFGGEPRTGYVSFEPPPSDAPAERMGEIRVLTDDEDAIVTIGTHEPLRANGLPVVHEVAPRTPVRVRVAMPSTIKGYTTYDEMIQVEPGQVVKVRATPIMLWGKEGRVFTWIYDNVFDPCNSTLFALLAFFIASAAFRAFRARNTEAALLLGSAILVMLGSMPLMGHLSYDFVDVKEWIVDVGNNSGRRAIMMGAALGAIVTGLRIVLGIERSHLGAD